MKRTFLNVLMISVLSMLVGACGNSTKATKFSGTVIPKTEATANSPESKVKSEEISADGVSAKSAIKLPGQFKCIARDSVWYTVAKLNETTFTADLTEKPLLEVKSEAKELNFKIGREFIEGEKINQELNPECENTVEHTDQKYEWTYSCRYFARNGEEEKQQVALQKSYFKVSSSGVGQLCRSVDAESSQCWDLSECK